MESQYGIAITNRFIGMIDIDDDPFEVVKRQQDAKNKKEKPAPKPKQSGGKKTDAQSNTKVKEQNVHKKEEKERTNSAKPSERGGGRGRREPREIRENDGDRRPPRRQGPKDFREHRGDENVPPEFRDRPEGSSGGFGRDGERGRGRGRGRGGFRGGRGDRRGGFGRSDGEHRSENRGGGERQGFGMPKRDFDRHSGSDKTGIKAVEKKEGGGARNWGSYKDDLAEPQENEERQPAEESTENIELNESAEGEQTGVDAEEQPKQMTLDEWKSLQKTERTKPTFNIRKPGEGVEGSQWKKGTAYTKKKVESDEEDDEEDDEDDEEKRHAAKNLLDIKITFNDPVRRGRGGRRPRGARGGRGSGGRGERKPRDSAPRMDDETDFPRLVKSAA